MEIITGDAAVPKRTESPRRTGGGWTNAVIDAAKINMGAWVAVRLSDTGAKDRNSASASLITASKRRGYNIQVAGKSADDILSIRIVGTITPG